MKTLFMSIATIIFAIGVYLASRDLDILLMITAIYSLSGYWLLSNTKGVIGVSFLKEKTLIKIFLIGAYATLNFFVIRNAIDFGGRHIVYAIAWLLVTSFLVVLKWPDTKYRS